MKTQETDLYKNLEIKRDLLERVEKLLAEQLRSAEIIDNKAWELLKITSAIMGIITPIQFMLIAKETSYWISISLGVFVLICYVLHVCAIMRIISLMEWIIVPGIPEVKLDFDEFLIKYMNDGHDNSPDQNDYYDQLLTDYLGTDGEKGAIQKAQENNTDKGKYLKYALYSLFLIILGLSILAIIYSIHLFP